MIDDPFDIAGRTAVITGSSQGIGRVTAERFAAAGANVVVSSRSPDRIEAVADGIDASDASGEAIAVECDVRDRAAVEALVESAVGAFGSLDCLVNNAGASFMAEFDDISENGWRTILDINLTGTYRCSQAAGEVMQEQDAGGTIVNLASVAGTRGAPHMSHYGAAKAGVVNLTTTLASEYAPHGIRVNCVAPGFVATPGVASQMGIEAGDVDRDEVDRRMGLPAEIADTIRFLASDASSYLVGETIVAGGVPDIEETPEV